MQFEQLSADYSFRLFAKYSRSWGKARKQQFLNCFPVIALIGAVVGCTLISFHWALAALILFGPMMVVVFWHRPEYGLYLFFALVIMLTDAVPKSAQGTGIFAIQDLKVVEGVPPLLVSFLLVMCLIYFFKLYLVKHEKSLITVRPAYVLIVILLIATATGLWRGWNSIDLRVDAMNVVYPALCFYLCANVLDTQRKIYRMLTVIFLVGVIHASILDVYFLSGHGWPYSDEDAGIARIVTQDTKTLMVFVAMTVTGYSVSMSKILTGWRRMFALAGCLPMLFAILFSFRRSLWIGVIASLIVFYILSSRFDRRRTFVWAGAVVLATTLLLASNGMVSSEMARPFVQRMLSIQDPNQSSNEHHYMESEQVLEEILSSPIVGLGLGSIHAPIHGLRDWWAPEKQPTRIVHNGYLLVWMKLGLPGILFLLWMLIRYASVLLRSRTSAVSPQSGPIIAGTGSLFGLWFVLLLIAPITAYWYETFTIGLFAAMTLGLIREEQLKKPKRTQLLA